MPRKIKTRKRRVGGMKRGHDKVSDSGVKFVAHDDLDTVLKKKQKLAIDEGRFEDLSTLPSDDEGDVESSSSASSSSSSSSSSVPSPQPSPSSAEQKPVIVKQANRPKVDQEQVDEEDYFYRKFYSPIRDKYIRLYKDIWDSTDKLKNWARVVAPTYIDGVEHLEVVYPLTSEQVRNLSEPVKTKIIPFSYYWKGNEFPYYKGERYQMHVGMKSKDEEGFKRATNQCKSEGCNVMGGKKKKRKTRKRKKTKRRNKKTRKPKVKRTKGRK